MGFMEQLDADGAQAQRHCRGCNQVRSLDRFAVDRTKSSGRKSRCRECSGKSNALWKLSNLPRLAAQQRLYRSRRPHIAKQVPQVLYIDRAMVHAKEQLDQLDPSLRLMPDGWEPHDPPRNPPHSENEHKRWERYADQILDAYADVVDESFADQDSLAVIDADGWVWPYWLRVSTVIRLKLANGQARTELG